MYFALREKSIYFYVREYWERLEIYIAVGFNERKKKRSRKRHGRTWIPGCRLGLCEQTWTLGLLRTNLNSQTDVGTMKERKCKDYFFYLNYLKN